MKISQLLLFGIFFGGFPLHQRGTKEFLLDEAINMVWLTATKFP
jgi:hypothetical protein